MESIKHQDFKKIIKYATVYGLANERDDILRQCSSFRQQAKGQAQDGLILLDKRNEAAFGSLCLYAVASAGSADDASAIQICRITREHSRLLTQDDRASAIVVADMLRDKQKGEQCPFCQLYKYLKKEEAGSKTRDVKP